MIGLLLVTSDILRAIPSILSGETRGYMSIVLNRWELGEKKNKASSILGINFSSMVPENIAGGTRQSRVQLVRSTSALKGNVCS